jgi:outer membrane lipoprotein
MNRLAVVMLSAALMTACAQIPEQIRDVPPGAPTVSEVRANAGRFNGARVRWGGTIAGVNNREEQTTIEVVARALLENARPSDSDRSQGRFLARFQGFLDPAIYSKGREITVVGTIAGQQMQAIDEYEYRYPVVEADSHYLWEPLPEYDTTPDPYLYSPLYYDPFFYDPFFYNPFLLRNPYYW